jgi:hypothetical protein
MPEVRFLNLEYFFYKVYDFFDRIFSGSSNGGYTNSVSGTSFWDKIVHFFTETLSFVWILVIIAFLVLFCVVIYTRLKMYDLDQEHKAKYNDHFVKPIPPPERARNPRWEYIETMFTSSNSNDWRVAIIEADAMLDELVQSYNFPGNTLAERLKNASPKVMPTLQSAWQAHLVRNKIAHEGVNYQLSEREAQIVRKHFEFVFINAGII